MTTTDEVRLPAQRSGAELVAAYAAAWNAHDGAQVAALVGGSYSDPMLAAPVRGADLAGLVDALCAAFPDLRFEPVRTVETADVAVFEWVMHGTNTGSPLPGAPAPTGGSVALPGVDVITVVDGRIDDVVGYFDQKAFVEQLGLRTLVVPQDGWPVTFGTSTRVDLGSTTQPGALTMTWLEVADDEQDELVRRSTDIVTALASDPGFIGFQSTTIGTLNTTLTAWTSPQAAEAAVARATPHEQARKHVEGGGFGKQGWTSFWQPYRLNPQFVRCACGEGASFADGPTATCVCGQVLQARPYL